MKTFEALIVVLLLLVGVWGVYCGFVQPYPIVDMNGDGVIDWKDYDVNGDGLVDMRDIVLVTRAYGVTVGDSKYNSKCDFNADGKIDDYDLNAIKDYFGQGSMDIVSLIGYRLTTPKGMQGAFGVICILAAAVLALRWSKR
jgi:hypothetical protein